MIAIPGVRTIAIVLCASMLLSLVLMNYHFVSDVIAGSVLGALIAMYAAHLAGLNKYRASIPVSDSSNTQAIRVNVLPELKA